MSVLVYEIVFIVLLVVDEFWQMFCVFGVLDVLKYLVEVYLVVGGFVVLLSMDCIFFNGFKFYFDIELGFVVCWSFVQFDCI